MNQNHDFNGGSSEESGENRYLAASELWIRRGKPGKSPQAPDYGTSVCDVLENFCRMEKAIRDETGLSHWRYYDPKYYDPMMAARRKAFEAGQDPDQAAKDFHQRYVDQYRSTNRRRA